MLKNFLRNDSGAAGVEYGILVAFIAAGMIIAVAAIGGYIQGAFNQVCTALSGSGITSATTNVC